MIEQNKLIEFKGILTFDIIAGLINELKIKMDEYQENVNIYKRILTIMVETLENICKYAIFQYDNNGIKTDVPSEFSLVKNDDKYILTTGNLIKLEDQQNINDRINMINHLDSSGIRKLYRKIISDGKFNSEGGAGLGFIEMAKSSQGKINHNFKHVNNDNVFFTINLEITK